MGALRSYQADAAGFALDALSERGGAGLFLDMGLGKTLTSIAVMDVLHEADPSMRFLVVAPPLIAKYSWPDELAKWSGLHSLDWTVLDGSPKKRLEKLESGAAVTVVSQGLLKWLDDNVNRWPWRLWVIDELSGYKNPGSVRFRVLKARRANLNAHPLPSGGRSRTAGPKARVLGLTGTPATKNLLDLWAQMYLLDGGATLGPTMSGYRDEWFRPTRVIQGPYGPQAVEWEPRAGARRAILGAVAPECMSMRASDKLPDLPPLVEQDHWLDMPKATRRTYSKIRRDLAVRLDDGQEVTAANAGVLTGKLSQLAAGCLYPDPDDPTGVVEHMDDAKLDELTAIRESSDGQLLVFYRFKDELERMRARFGSDLHEVHEPDIVARWNRGEVPMLAAHPLSAKFGLNLQDGGHEVVWTTLPWSLDDYSQANARLNRSGQRDTVVVHRLVERGTVDERILDVLAERASLHDSVMAALRRP